MSTRPRAEIMRDLKAILAELDYCMHGEDATAPDISPKLEHALDQTRSSSAMPIGPAMTHAMREQERTQSHEDIRAKARAYKDHTVDNKPYNKPEQPERLKDYTPADDPNWDEAVFLGTGDHKAD